MRRTYSSAKRATYRLPKPGYSTNHDPTEPVNALVSSYAAPSPPPRPGDVAGTLRLLAYLALGVALVVIDHRGGWLHQARQQAALLVQPLWTVAGWPGRVIERLYDDAGTVSQLTEENERLRNQLLVYSARLARLQPLAADNARLRGLLDATPRGGLEVQLAPILDIDLDPTRQRLVLDAGGNDGVSVGQTVIDAGGLVGQIIAVKPTHATVLLLTDPSHAVPVAVSRSGVRLVAYGQGRIDLLRVPSIPLSSDVKVGDTLVTSGLGGRFPAGFPVGTITSLTPDYSRAFLVGEVEPAAHFDRGRDVLLLRSAPAARGESGVGSGEEARARKPVGSLPPGVATRPVTEGRPSATSISASHDQPVRDRSKLPTPYSPLPAPERGSR